MSARSTGTSASTAPPTPIAGKPGWPTSSLPWKSCLSPAGSPLRTNEHTQATIRQKLYGPFRILFIIRENKAYVLTVRHGARTFLDPDELPEA